MLSALTLGRAIRYVILAYLGTLYGRQIVALLRQHGYQMLAVYAVLITLLSAFVLFRYYKWKAAKRPERPAVATAPRAT